MRTTNQFGSQPKIANLLLVLLGLGLITPDSTTVSAAAVEIPLVDAVKTADSAAVQALLEQRVDVNTAETDGTTALHWAAYRGDLTSAQLLLHAGATPDKENRYGVTPLALASGRGNAPIVEALLNA